MINIIFAKSHNFVILHFIQNTEIDNDAVMNDKQQLNPAALRLRNAIQKIEKKPKPKVCIYQHLNKYKPKICIYQHPYIVETFTKISKITN